MNDKKVLMESLVKNMETMMQYSLQLKKEAEIAKTKAKEKIKLKKLKKNNEKISNYLIYLDKLTKENEE